MEACGRKPDGGVATTNPDPGRGLVSHSWHPSGWVAGRGQRFPDGWLAATSEWLCFTCAQMQSRGPDPQHASRVSISGRSAYSAERRGGEEERRRREHDC